MPGLSRKHGGLLPRRGCALLRNQQLDDEPATRHEMPGRIPKARYLLSLSEQVRNAVEYDIHQRKLAWDRGAGHVAMNNGDRHLVRLRSELFDHGAGKLDAGDWHAAF